MPAPAPVRVGFIGAGSICRQRHLPGLRDIAGVELVAVCNRSEESSRRVAQDFGFAHVETEWRQLVSRDDIDAVFIGTWPYTHAEMSIAALEHGRHVFCQARMASTLEDAKAMLAAAEKRPDLVNMICPPPHRMPWEPFIRKFLADGELGELRHVHVMCIDGSNLGPLTWRERVEYSGIQIMQVGIWAETLHAWLGEYDTLIAKTNTLVPTKDDEAGNPYTIRIPQSVNVGGRLTNGVRIAEIHFGLSPEDTRNHLYICGSKGALYVDAMERIRFGGLDEGPRPIDVPAELLRDWQVEQDFIDAVRLAMQGAPASERPVSPDFAEGVKYMRKMAAIHQSAETGTSVKLSDF